MKNEVTINGKEYSLRKIDFDGFCELEDLGFCVEQVEDKTFKSLRALVAFIMKTNVKNASREIEEHVNGGADLDEMAIALFGMVSQSDFFRKLSQQQ